MYISDVYKDTLQYHNQRFNNNSVTILTDQKNLTLIRTSAKEYPLSGCPKLPLIKLSSVS